MGRGPPGALQGRYSVQANESHTSSVLSSVNPKDCVYTPRWATEALVRWIGELGCLHQFRSLLDPFAGDGAILRAFPAESFDCYREAWEIRPEEHYKLREVAHPFQGDWMVMGDSFNGAIVTNPPYTNGMAESAIHVCLKRAPVVVALLPLSFLTTQVRSRWLRLTPLVRVGLLTSRPQFLLSSYAREKRLEEGNTKWGTNMSEYAWYWWDKDYPKAAPQLHWLDRE